MTSSRHATFFAGVRTSAAPMLLWSAHFAFCYVAVAVGCAATGGQPPAFSLRLALVSGTAFALAAGVWLLVRACRADARTPGALLAKVRLSLTVLALVGIAWTALPLAFLPLCG